MENITEYGEVVNLTGRTAHVRFVRSSACGRCKACGMLSGENQIIVHVDNVLGAAVGDRVAVSIRMQKALRASALAYVFPLLMLIAGVFVGWLAADALSLLADISMALFGIGFALLAFVLLKLTAPLYNKSVGNVYKMVDKKHD